MNTHNIELQNSHLDLEDETVQKVLSLYDQHDGVLISHWTVI